ncbi:MAG: T9SS type A sorting domain-containing protein [Bacteroidetes bacterium]|nr:T9SS type A sorting domain-containing protein [Bacteroidota bacterium]
MKLLYVLPFLVVIALLSGLFSLQKALSEPQRPHLHQDLKNAELPMGFNDLFAGSGDCQLCHDAQVNAQGDFIGIVSDWRSSMMAHSSKDPFWRAKVSHETLVNPQHAELLENVCTRCHAPVGHFNAHFNGQEFYSIAEMDLDPLAKDGVNCTVCHQITPESLGNYSGELEIGTEKKIWGPHEAPFTNPMINHTGYTPTFSPHIQDARICASCHSLMTPTIDYSGNLTGTDFPEQAIYHEWLNSDFSVNEVTCQKCHMPSIEDTVKISSMPPWLDGRSPFAQHQLAGANVFMLKLMKENMEELGITATEWQMDSTINRARRMLQQAALSMQLNEVARTPDTLFLEMILTNHAGHKFPAGYPSRRAFIELLVMNEYDTLFHSGKMDGDYNIIGEDEGFEVHHETIQTPDQVQIYEMVMGDVNLEPTTVLAYAFQHLKDNRIPPSGFKSSHFTWDTVAVTGQAMYDPDFNFESGIEGSGSDRVLFHVPLNGNNDALEVIARVHYQTVSGRWLEDMLDYSSDEIDAFKMMYEVADKTPVLVAEADLTSTSTDIRLWQEELFSVHPNPGPGRFNVQSENPLTAINVYDQSGRLNQTIHNFASPSVSQNMSIRIDGSNGVYYLEMLDDQQNRRTTKIILNK